jgi:gliding motility-associated-like protein
MKNKLFVFLLLILSVRAYSQCTLTVNLTASSTAICSGNPVVLTASATAGTPAYNYVWSTGETTQSISVNKAATYTVSVSDQTAGCQPITKTITLTTGTTPPAPTAADAITCPNTSATITASGSSGTYQWYDAPTGGNFLASGGTYHTPPINTKSIFYVETTISGCPSARTPVTVYPIAGPDVVDGSTCAGSSVTLTASGAGSYQWFDAPSGGTQVGTGPAFTTPALFATKNYYVVGTTAGCVSSPTQATATVRPAPSAPVSSGITICSGSVATLHATADPGSVFDWYSVPTGGISLISSPDYTTPALTNTTTYYVQATVNSCIGPRTAVTVTVNPIPAAPTAADISGCSGYPVTLTATAPGGTYNWYATATSTTILATGNTYTTPVLNTSTTFYVEVVSAGGCTSLRKVVNVTINPSPTAPTAAGQTICSGNAATLTAVGPGGSYEWYAMASGGTLLVAGASYTTPVLNATTTYYVQTTQGGCTSPRAAIVVTVNPTPVAPTASGVTICSGSTATLSASGTGSGYEWYDAATAGNLVASTQNFITPALITNTTYYVQTISTGCVSPRTAVTVTVNAVPSAPTANGVTTCAGTSATLTATGTGTIQWFNVATGGTPVATGNTYTTATLAVTTTYYVQATNGTCASTRIAVTVTVTSTTNQFTYSSGTYCKSGTNPTPLINVPGGTFSSSPIGLSINSNNGTIDLTTSIIGSYTITYNNACAISTEQVAIVVAPDANFTYSAPAYCQGSANVSPIYTTPASSGGVFSAAPSGLVFKNPNTGVIDMTASAPGTYSVINTINGLGGCPTVTSLPVSVKIDPKVIVDAGPDQFIATGTSTTLAGSVTGGITTGTWSAGSGTFSPNATTLNATYTPAVGVSAVTLTLTSDDPGTSCGPQSDQVIINISAQPAPPIASGTSICSGSVATLLVSPPFNGTYDWFSALTGGPSLFTGINFTTSPLTTTTIYYVQTTVGGVASNRTAVTVTVNAIPVAPTAQGVTICSGTQATLTASGSTGIYQWYDAATGGSLQGTGASFTTQFLTANTSYYVQANLNSCISPTRTKVDVIVNPAPNVTSAATGSICSDNPLNYIITADLPNATFSYSRATVAGISNPGFVNQPGNTITETLTNTTGTNIIVTYVITPTLNGCQGAPFNFTVTVYPVATVSSPNTGIVCSGASPNYTITFNTTGTIVSWSRAAVAGISNVAVSGQISSSIQEALINTTIAPIDVVYNFTYSTANCAGGTFKFTLTVNPKVDITSAKTGVACGGTPQGYTITSQVPSAVYSWSRAAIPEISNPAVTNTSNFINESLVNISGAPVTVDYLITTINNGCQTAPFKYSVLVYPQPPTPIANSNSPVCTGKTINLLTPTLIAGGSYAWTGPTGFSSSLQNPVINNVTAANAGTYTLYLLANGCSSVGATVDVLVDAVPVANAGPDIAICNTATSVPLAGSVSGGTTTGTWSTSGTGTFSPSAADLNGQYLPSAQDKAAGSVKITLVSTSKDDCAISVDDMIIKFQPVPATNAGGDSSVCVQNTSINLNGKMLVPGNGTWSTTGSGTFSPSTVQINGGASPIYILSAADKVAGSIKFTLTANTVTPCDIPSADVTITLAPPPIVNAGGSVFVLKGNTVILAPQVNDSNVTYAWSPNIFISDTTAKNPTITGDVDRVYTLKVTDSRGCTTTDKVNVVIAPTIIIPNTFTPNNDGVNDLWDITGLIAYISATVDIYNRNGQKLFHSIGYGKPWDGTYNNKPLPFGTYYYVIDTKLNNKIYSGYVAIVK